MEECQLVHSKPCSIPTAYPCSQYKMKTANTAMIEVLQGDNFDNKNNHKPKSATTLKMSCWCYPYTKIL